jgi:hypothetical protein
MQRPMEVDGGPRDNRVPLLSSRHRADSTAPRPRQRSAPPAAPKRVVMTSRSWSVRPERMRDRASGQQRYGSTHRETLRILDTSSASTKMTTAFATTHSTHHDRSSSPGNEKHHPIGMRRRCPGRRRHRPSTTPHHRGWSEIRRLRRFPRASGPLSAAARAPGMRGETDTGIGIGHLQAVSVLYSLLQDRSVYRILRILVGCFGRRWPAAAFSRAGLARANCVG